MSETNTDARKAAEEYALADFKWPVNKKGEPVTIPAGQVNPTGFKKHCKIAKNAFLAGFEFAQSHPATLNKGEVSEESVKLLDGLVCDVGNLLSETDHEWQSAGYYMAAKEFLKSLQPNQKQ